MKNKKEEVKKNKIYVPYKRVLYDLKFECIFGIIFNGFWSLLLYFSVFYHNHFY